MIKKMVLLSVSFILLPSLVGGMCAGGMEGDSGSVPKVIYSKPAGGGAGG